MKSNLLLAVILMSAGLLAPNLYGAEVSKKVPAQNTKNQKKWGFEPTSFAGLSLTSPIEGLPNCPYKEIKLQTLVYFEDFDQWKEMVDSDKALIACVNLVSRVKKPTESIWDSQLESFRLSSARDISPFSDMTAVVVDKKIMNLTVRFSSGDYQQAKSILVEKYGEPHKVESGSLQTQGGASFPTETLNWQGDSFSMTIGSMTERKYSERDKKIIERGTLTISNLNWKKAVIESGNDQIKQKANNL